MDSKYGENYQKRNLHGRKAIYWPRLTDADFATVLNNE